MVLARPASGPVDTPREELAALHQDAFGWALALTAGDRAEAEEVLQTAYLRILDGRARYGGRAQLKTWLFGVIRLLAIERRRRRRGRALAWLRRGAVAEPPPPSPAERADRAAEAARLRRALRRLSDRQQQVLHLTFYQEMTIAEAAEVLHIGAGSARTHYERGKQHLRRLLGKEEL